MHFCISVTFSVRRLFRYLSRLHFISNASTSSSTITPSTSISTSSSFPFLFSTLRPFSFVCYYPPSHLTSSGVLPYSLSPRNFQFFPASRLHRHTPPRIIREKVCIPIGYFLVMSSSFFPDATHLSPDVKTSLDIFFPFHISYKLLNSPAFVKINFTNDFSLFFMIVFQL